MHHHISHVQDQYTSAFIECITLKYATGPQLHSSIGMMLPRSKKHNNQFKCRWTYLMEPGTLLSLYVRQFLSYAMNRTADIQQSDRDVSSQVPINFVPHPGVYVTAACFGNNVFSDGGANNCLSNLLSSQIQRYVIDLYWDTTNRRFGLCPRRDPELVK